MIRELADRLEAAERTKFVELPYVLSSWLEEHGGLDGRKVLDFGCGEGTSAAGIALLYNCTVHGVDINDEASECAAFLRDRLKTDMPPNLTFQEISPGGEIEGQDYDCIFSWSVFEHVQNRIYGDVLKDLHARLRRGGLFFMQISPLYFSPEGSHLWAIGYRQWEHLLNQHSEAMDDLNAADMDDASRSSLKDMFKTLNRVTAEDVIERFEAAGFELLRQQRDRIDIDPPDELTRAYALDALKTFQLVALFRRGE